MNRLLFTVLLALAIAISIISLAKAAFSDSPPAHKLTQNSETVCSDPAGCTIQATDATSDGKTLAVSAKAVKNADDTYTAQLTVPGCSACQLPDEPVPQLNKTSGLKDIQAALQKIASSAVAKAKAIFGANKTDDKKAQREKDELKKKEDEAEKQVKLCKAKSYELDDSGKKYKLEKYKDTSERLSCLTANYEKFLDSDDDAEAKLAKDLLADMTAVCVKAHQDSSTKSDDLRGSCQDFIDDHNEAGDNAGLLLAFEIQNALYQQHNLNGDVSNISAMITSSDVQGAAQALTLLKAKAALPMYSSQKSLTARNSAITALQKYNASLGDSIPSDGVQLQMASLLNSGVGLNVQSQISTLTTQLNLKAIQIQQAQGMTTNSMINSAHNTALSMTNSALLSTPNALSFLARNGEVPRDYSRFGIGDASGYHSWNESNFRQILGSPQGTLTSAALQTQNGMINGTMCQTLNGSTCSTAALNQVPATMASNNVPMVNVLNGARGGGR